MAKKQKIFWAILIGGLFLLCLIPRVLLALGIPLPRLGPAPHQALECRNRLTGESIAIPLEPIDVDYAGGQNTYFTTDLSLGQMVEQMEALDEPPFDQVVQAGSSEAWVRSGRSFYLLYQVQQRRIPHFEAGSDWYFTDFSAEVYRRGTFLIAFPFHLARGDLRLCLPDMAEPIRAERPGQPAARYTIGAGARQAFWDFYQQLGYYQTEQTEDGFCLTGYAQGLEGPQAQFPLYFHFDGDTLWLS